MQTLTNKIACRILTSTTLIDSYISQQIITKYLSAALQISNKLELLATKTQQQYYR